MRPTWAVGFDTLGAFLGAENALGGGPGGSGSKPRGLRSSQEQPRDLQKQLESDKNEFQKNRKFELQDASGGLRETRNPSNRLAGAMEKDIPGHPWMQGFPITKPALGSRRVRRPMTRRSSRTDLQFSIFACSGCHGVRLRRGLRQNDQ